MNGEVLLEWDDDPIFCGPPRFNSALASDFPWFHIVKVWNRKLMNSFLNRTWTSQVSLQYCFTSMLTAYYPMNIAGYPVMSVKIFSWCQRRAICRYVAYGILGLADCNCHRFASLKSYFDGIWYWVSSPELPWSNFQFHPWAQHFLTKLASL